MKLTKVINGNGRRCQLGMRKLPDARAIRCPLLHLSLVSRELPKPIHSSSRVNQPAFLPLIRA